MKTSRSGSIVSATLGLGLLTNVVLALIYVGVAIVGGLPGAAIAATGALCVMAVLALSRRAGAQSAVVFVLLLWSVRPYNALVDALWGADVPYWYRLVLGGLLWVLVWDSLHLLLGAGRGRLLGPKR